MLLTAHPGLCKACHLFQWHVLYCLQLTNVIGKRYGVHPSTSTERYKGQSHVKLADADPESRKPWKTTNGVSWHAHMNLCNCK
jgi:hypothetical protein